MYNAIYINREIKGEVDENIEFEFEADTEVNGSCVATLKGEFYVLGGTNYKRQVIFLLTDL